MACGEARHVVLERIRPVYLLLWCTERSWISGLYNTDEQCAQEAAIDGYIDELPIVCGRIDFNSHNRVCVCVSI